MIYSKEMKILFLNISSFFFFFILMIGLFQVFDRQLRLTQNDCIMSYMFPNYLPFGDKVSSRLSHEYNLYYYLEGKENQNVIPKKFDGIPVLFVPGNAGSYKQVRSFAAESYRIVNKINVFYNSEEPSKVNKKIVKKQNNLSNFSINKSNYHQKIRIIEIV